MITRISDSLFKDDIYDEREVLESGIYKPDKKSNNVLVLMDKFFMCDAET